MMFRLALIPAVLLASGPALASERPPLTLEQRMSMRCSAAFAMIAHRQEQGEPAALALPRLGAAGREYFVRAAAQVMDEAGLGEQAVAEELAAEAQDIAAKGTLEAVVQVCLPQLGDGPRAD